jgi:predicted nucleic-acid-binding Zn-ribbon protein
MSDDQQQAERLQRLEQQISQLTEEVSALRAELGGARGRVELTMKRQTRCPGCGKRKLLHASWVLDRGESNMREKMALAKPSIWRKRTVGEFEIYTCLSCGLAEWYVRDPTEVPVDGKAFRIIDGDELEGQTPYR